MEEKLTEASSLNMVTARDHAVLNKNRLSVSSFRYDESVLQFIAKYYPQTSINEWNNWNWHNICLFVFLWIVLVDFFFF